MLGGNSLSPFGRDLFGGLGVCGRLGDRGGHDFGEVFGLVQHGNDFTEIAIKNITIEVELSFVTCHFQAIKKKDIKSSFT